jgi:hypothetical protein
VQQVANHSLANATAFSTPSSKDRSATELEVREEQASTNPSVSLVMISGSPCHTLLPIALLKYKPQQSSGGNPFLFHYVFPTPIDNNSGFIGS